MSRPSVCRSTLHRRSVLQRWKHSLLYVVYPVGIRNTETTERTGLPALMDQTQQHLWSCSQTWERHPSTSSPSAPDRHLSRTTSQSQSWKRPPDRPRSKWLDHIRSDNNLSPADLWRSAVRRGHSGVTQRSQLATRRQRRRRVYPAAVCAFWPTLAYFCHCDTHLNNGLLPPSACTAMEVACRRLQLF